MMTSSRTIRRTATELLCLLLCATCYFFEVRPASAQGTDLGTIRGAVIDSQRKRRAPRTGRARASQLTNDTHPLSLVRLPRTRRGTSTQVLAQ